MKTLSPGGRGEGEGGLDNIMRLLVFTPMGEGGFWKAIPSQSSRQEKHHAGQLRLL